MYNNMSCNALEKPFYTPTEAAIRWCNLIAHEAEILSTVGLEPVPPASAFPQWPCLRANAEKILDAMLNGGITYGRDGKTVPPGDHVAKHRLTIRHADLKAWMASNYPDQKPPFLFDEIERTTHSAISIENFQALQAERDALKARLEKAEKWYRDNAKAINELRTKQSAQSTGGDEPLNYTTRLLQIQSEAIQKFWINYDPSEPDTAPDKSAIINWLTTEKGCSQQQAQAIDLIIRHDSRKSGGAKPKG